MTDDSAFKEHIRVSLLKMGLLVEKCVNHKLDVNQFTKEYGNFFYYEALDGHEANAEQARVFDQYRESINFHRHIQQDVVDKVYVGSCEQEEEYLKSGRISKSEANERLKMYWNQYQTVIYALETK